MAPHLGNTDAWTVELAAGIMARLRAGKTTMGDERLLASLLAKMGLTPADRARVPAPRPAPPANPFANLDDDGDEDAS